MTRQGSVKGPDGRELARRGSDAQTLLAHEFGMHEYVWPGILGESREKWEQVAALVDRAAQHDHIARCSSFDGKRGHTPPFAGAHADGDRHRMQVALTSLLAVGLPRFLTEKNP